MKDLEYYMNLEYPVEIVPDYVEGGYAAQYPDLPGCITCADTMEEVLESLTDAKRAWITSMLESGQEIYDPNEEARYSGNIRLRMPKELHKSLVYHAKREGISLNQYCIYLLSRYDALKYGAR